MTQTLELADFPLRLKKGQITIFFTESTKKNEVISHEIIKIKSSRNVVRVRMFHVSKSKKK